MRLLIVFAAVASAALAQLQTPATDIYRRTHDALMSSFLPVDELKNDPKISQLLTAAEDGIWASAGQNPQFRHLITPFVDLKTFGSACGIDGIVLQSGTAAYADMTRPQRERVLTLLQNCSANEPRRLAATLRNFYVVKAYGAIQEPLTGVKLNLYAPADWVARNRPQLPPTRLRYDSRRKEITSVDGLIDYLVVGSGPAGSVLSHELRRGGKRVVLIEKGSFIVPGSMETRLIDDLIDTRTTADGAIRVRNGLAVGGGSQVNVDLCFAPTLPSIQARIDGWRREGRIGKEDFTPGQLSIAYQWVKSAIGTRVLSESEINPNNRALWDGAKLAGLHPALYDLNTYPPGKSPYPVTDKRSSESQLVIESLQDSTNPLAMVPDADVRQVLFDENYTATGVEMRMRAPITDPGVIPDPNGFHLPSGTLVTIHARNIILSAGALGSPSILLRSGVKNDQIGRGIVLHVSMPIMGLFDRIIDALTGTEASVYVPDKLISDGYAFESMSDQPLYAALMSPGPPMHTFEMVKSYRHLAGFGVMLIDTPSPDNRITLDQSGEPIINYVISEPDKVRFRHGVAEAVRMMLLAGAKKVFIPTTEDILGDGVSPVVLTNPKQADFVERNLHFIPNRTIVTSAHMQATDKMGSNPANSVVGRDFRVWGTTHLYVVDGSVFPTSIGANPMQSIYTFAKIFADRFTGGDPN
ncbi:MAG: GMC oxidoreductase [Bryobacteraceae bacterium]